MAKQVLAPPYTPGFGQRPPVVAGRDPLIDDAARVLEVGPEHPRFCRALLGSRGTGETVLLDVIGEVASKKLGWGVLRASALRREPGSSVCYSGYRRRLSPAGAWAGVPGPPLAYERRIINGEIKELFRPSFRAVGFIVGLRAVATSGVSSALSPLTWDSRPPSRTLQAQPGSRTGGVR